MASKIIIDLIDQAIEAGSEGSFKLHDIFYDLDQLLATDGKDAKIRNYFDCWSDAVNHDYLVYKIQDPNEWLAAARELKNWYCGEYEELSSRPLWKEVL